ncbi:sulfite exporter TauE/SafE family protein [Roseomonas sp. GC11]|uniref:sulfite exporter TauE/SafE family protein n=1 Tax=Roseomonas sp. GC11 TaxID=2950546 RepID=UPI002109ED3B|nr:sulfite exporter TauE/SafE family protein [Roseomonas sp. GC11]MCQ4160692.1 sulfite exporter TauE/SafE family protein [Roseomonas sp. GC11]
MSAGWEAAWEAALALLQPGPLLVAALATAIAGLMRGYSGFGTAILLAPVYSTLWGPRTGVPVMLLMELAVSAYLLPRAIAQANQRVIFSMSAAAVLATPVGAIILFAADGAVLRQAIGALVLGFGLLLMSPWRYHGSRPLALNLAIGTVSGLMKGATGMSGPPVILYLLSGPEAAAQHRANLILYFGVIGIAAVIPPLWGGLMGLPVLLLVALMLPVLLGAVPVGARLFHVIPVAWYRRMALVALLAAGGFALLG